MICGTTKSGFEWSVADDFGDDYELFEAIRESEKNPTAIVDVVKLTLGDEQTKRLKEHLRQLHGKVPLGAMNAEITEIMRTIPELKNS